MSLPSIPTFSVPVTFAILFGLLVIRYLVLSGSFYLWRPRPSKQNPRDMMWSVMSSAVFALAGALMIRLWQAGMTKIYLSFHAYPIWYLPLSLIIYLVIHDTYFYWTHRWQHRNYFQIIHFAHHESRDPTAWTSFAFHPLEALIQALILPLLIMVIPINVMVLGLFLLIMSFFGVTNHLGYEIYPHWFEKRLGLITATHHQHHHKNMSKNFGLYFTWWDTFLKTEGP